MNRKKVKTCVWDQGTYEVLGISGDTYCLRPLHSDDEGVYFVDADDVSDEKEETVDFVSEKDYGGDIRNDSFFGMAGSFMASVLNNPKALRLVKEGGRELSVSDENGILQMRMSYIRN